MGKILSVLQRRANRFNIESRAHKVISREKPTPAPMHEATQRALEKITKEHPEVLQEQLAKDSQLDERLKRVFVNSLDPLVTEHPSSSERPLPLSRQSFEAPEYGFHEPNMIPHGRYTLKQALKFITDHQGDPKVWTVTAIAKEYQLDQNVLDKILLYYRTFEVYIPELKDRKRQPIIAEPTQTKQQLEAKESPEK